MEQKLEDKAFEFYKTYLALKLHFKKEEYDFFDNEQRTNASKHSFLGRKDKYFFEKLAHEYNKDEFINKCLAEAIHNKDFWIREVCALTNSTTSLKRITYYEEFDHALSIECNAIQTYCLQNDISFEELILGIPGYCVLYKLYRKGIITLDTFIIFGMCFCGIWEELRVRGNNDPLVKDTLFLVKKYFPFISPKLPPIETTRELILNNLNLIRFN